MKNNKISLIYQPKFNRKGIIKINLFFLILDIICISVLFNYFNFKYTIGYIYLRWLCIIGFYVIKILKYSFIFVKHRLDVLLVTTNKHLQDDLYEESNLLKDIMSNNFKDILLALEFFILSSLFIYTIKVYMNMFIYFNLKSSIITHIFFICFVVAITYRMESKFKLSEDRHNILMFLASGDKI